MKYNNIIIYKKINLALLIFMVLGLFLSFSWTNNVVFAQPDILSLANNIANQAISQGQSSVQNALCLTGISDSSCNNTSVQNQVNHGNNALSQISGLGFGLGGRHHHNNNDDANVASQSINQGQSNSQFTQCVSGESLSNSCNNTSVQNQVNHGNNALSQQGGSGTSLGGIPENVASQSINQEQSSDQNAQCVSGKDAIVSCNNLNFQKQVNAGNNVLSQSFQ